MDNNFGQVLRKIGVRGSAVGLDTALLPGGCGFDYRLGLRDFSLI